MGLVSLGLGKKFDRYTLGGMYGIVPTEVSGGPLIETITLRQTYRVLQWERLSAYLGLNIFHVLGVRYRSADYRDVPDDYYPLGSVRGLLNIGGMVAFNKIETRLFYLEAGLNDVSLVNLYSNSEVLNFSEEVSLGIGIKQLF